MVAIQVYVGRFFGCFATISPYTHIFIWAAIIILLPVFGERYRNKVNIVAGDADTDMSHLVSIVDH